MIAILGLQLIVSSNIRILIFLVCKKFFAVLLVIRRPTCPWDLSVAVLYIKWYPLEFIGVFSSFVHHRCSCMATTSILNILHPVVIWWSLPGLNSARTLYVENFRNWRYFSFDTLSVIWVVSVCPPSITWLRSIWAALIPFRFEFRFNVINVIVLSATRWLALMVSADLR